MPEQLGLLHTSSHALRSVVNRGLAEGHLHLWGVLTADETWADHLLKPPPPGDSARLRAGGDAPLPALPGGRPAPRLRRPASSPRTRRGGRRSTWSACSTPSTRRGAVSRSAGNAGGCAAAAGGDVAPRCRQPSEYLRRALTTRSPRCGRAGAEDRSRWLGERLGDAPPRRRPGPTRSAGCCPEVDAATWRCRAGGAARRYGCASACSRWTTARRSTAGRTSWRARWRQRRS